MRRSSASERRRGRESVVSVPQVMVTAVDGDADGDEEERERDDVREMKTLEDVDEVCFFFCCCLGCVCGVRLFALLMFNL